MYKVSAIFIPLIFIIDFFGYILYPKRFFSSVPDTSSVKAILVIRIEELGDIVLSIPLFDALKKAILRIIFPTHKSKANHH